MRTAQPTATNLMDAGAPLIAHHGAIGDLIQLTAMMQVLAERWGRRCDVLAGGSPAGQILEGLPFVGEVRTLGTRKRPYWSSPDQWELVRWLRRREPSPCYVVERWRRRVAPWSQRTRLELLLDKAGIAPEHWVTSVERERPLLEHAVDYYTSLAERTPRAWAAAPPPQAAAAKPRLAVSGDEIATCSAWLRELGWRGEPLIAVQAVARRPGIRGSWPKESWATLISDLRQELPEARILFCGAPAEARQTEELAAACAAPRVTSVAADLPLRRLFALLALAHSCISLDTGPAHAAVALACPLVVITGTADPRRNRPLGDSQKVAIVATWARAEWPDDPQVWFHHHDMRAIAPATVLDAWRQLQSAPARGSVSRSSAVAAAGRRDEEQRAGGADQQAAVDDGR